MAEDARAPGHILITGAAKRMGRAFAKTFAAAGWFVTIHVNTSLGEAADTLEEVKKAGGDGRILALDLTDFTAYDAFFEKLVADSPPLTALINNASMFEYDEAWTSEPATLEKHFHVNAAAPILLSRRFAELVRERGGEGVIVNMLDNKVFAPNPDYFSYSISKYGLMGATELMAMALAPHVRVCGIAPGVTFVSGVQSDDDFEETRAMNPLKRAIEVEDICRTARFIVESRTLNGEIITVDGGQKLMKLERDVAFMTERQK
ncbi:SDR family NAD(P)-dependent oxidoreductase [Rhodobium gokarnense]|uniref:NAD(P)-dependent dehydrogenase (Short-subunit alcohol dehydrogenase family) n=1 Tax=Rhodobium gokarnense TaxID=364296 RepID=A0ABT3H5V2_9HYPH|nr:SDR family NAD(P)-dependent oxidoreductase [Rhodobium gokarnense]MCW2305772.1 NAD(P)-dependent dehydrogenase (short-subunit alcohol dehydrogenase family) [Rhodobium gokarnense]